jgi:hypothetical protein
MLEEFFAGLSDDLQLTRGEIAKLTVGGESDVSGFQPGRVERSARKSAIVASRT